MKILLVDDSRTMRNIQKKVLERLGGVEFVEAGDGVEGLSQIAATPSGFNLMLVDWNMPKMDGHTFVTRVRRTDKKTPMIMCTTEAEKSRVVEAIKAGVNNYVVKPFTPDALLDKVKSTLAKMGGLSAAPVAPATAAAPAAPTAKPATPVAPATAAAPAAPTAKPATPVAPAKPALQAPVAKAA